MAMRAEAQPCAQEIARVGAHEESSRDVYVIDDDSMVRRSLFFFLESRGYAPRSFRSGQDFLNEIDHLAPGCVVLDLRMPDLDGLGVLRSMGDRIVRYPVAVITGHGEISDAVAAMKLGAIDFLEKPFAENDLLEVVDRAWERLSDAMADEHIRQAAADRLKQLTPREKEVVQGLLDGLPNKLIAVRLEISRRTVEVHRSNLMSRLAVRSVSELVRLAMAAGMEPALELENTDAT